jgi:serine/threonine-protein kinase
MLGTPFYMSPEQGFGEKDVDHRADIWSLGVILYECLAGVRPTQAENIGQIFKIVVTDAIQPLATRMPGLPEDVTALVSKMLQRDRSRRPADLRAVVAVLAQYAAQDSPAFGAPKSPLAVTVETPSPHYGGAGLTMGALERPAVSAATRRRRGAYATLAAVVATTAGVGLWQLRGEPRGTSPGGPARSGAVATAPGPPIVTEPPSEPAVSSSAAPSPSAPASVGTTTVAATGVAPATAPPRAAVASSMRRSPPPAAQSSAAPARPAKTSIDPGSYQ